MTIASRKIGHDEVEHRDLSFRLNPEKEPRHNRQCVMAATFEHFTAVISSVMLDRLELWDDTWPEVSAMLFWHFVEETEHKSVNFDVFTNISGGGARANAVRMATFALGSAIFLPLIHGNWLYLLWLATFGRDNVDLVTTSIRRITPKGIETTDGVEREIDVLILATGYKVFEKGNLPSYEVIGRNATDLGEFWEANLYQAYEGLTVPGYPNFYIMLGPYALIGSSYFKMVEGNAIHLARCIEATRERDATCVEIRQDVHDHYFQDIQRRQQGTVYLNHNCAASNSYYFDRHGDAPILRPSTSFEMLWRAKHLPMNHYRFERAAAQGPDAKEEVHG